MHVKKHGHTHEPSRVVGVGADLPVDLDESLHDNLLYFSTVQRVLQTITKEDHHR